MSGSGSGLLDPVLEGGGGATSPKGKWIWIVLVPKHAFFESGRSEFYELSYWIRLLSKVLKYPTGYVDVCFSSSR